MLLTFADRISFLQAYTAYHFQRKFPETPWRPSGCLALAIHPFSQKLLVDFLYIVQITGPEVIPKGIKLAIEILYLFLSHNSPIR